MKTRMTKILFVSLLVQLFVFAPSSFAAQLGGITLPDSTNVAGTELTLNGIGLREATVFKVDVYVAGLYLEKKASNPSEIFADKGKKRLTMHFVRDVGADKIRKGWTDGFNNNTSHVAPLQERIAAFNKKMPDIKTGQTITLTFLESKVQIEIDSSQKGQIEGEDFQKALLAIWLGASPPNEDLKKGLLGL